MHDVKGEQVDDHFQEAHCEVRLFNNEENTDSDSEFDDDYLVLCISFKKLGGDYLLYLTYQKDIREHIKSLLDYTHKKYY
jgi:hypothetical protein